VLEESNQHPHSGKQKPQRSNKKREQIIKHFFFDADEFVDPKPILDCHQSN